MSGVKSNISSLISFSAAGISDKNVRFNVSIPEREKVKFVELLFFKFPSMVVLNGSSTISVVDIRTGKRLSTQEVSLATVGWVRFILPRGYIRRLIRKPKINKGLKLNITNSRLASLVYFATARTSPSLQPLLVVHCTDRRGPKQDQIVYVPKLRQRRKRYARTEGSCRRRILNLKTKDLGWDTWVIVPERFGVYYCAGSCLDPNSSRMKSIYARMRAMLNEQSAATTEGPCCAPEKLKPMSMLYYGGPGESTYVLQRMDDMVVVECACR